MLDAKIGVGRHPLAGAPDAAIAGRLFISPRTVETHRAHAMKKLGLRTTAEVVRYALRRGILGSEE